MMRMFAFPARIVLTLVVSGALSGCHRDLPTAPSETGIVIYEHANYSGYATRITSDVSNLKDLPGPCSPDVLPEDVILSWNDCISSVSVMPGWYAQLFVDDGFRGGVLTVTSDIPDLRSLPGPCVFLGGFNDCLSSVRVFKR